MVQSSTGTTKIVKMVVYDQVIESVFADASYLYCVKWLDIKQNEKHDDTACLDGQPKKSASTAAWHELRDKFVGVYMADLVFWPGIQFANFFFMPPHLQAPVVAFCSVGWGAYLSWASQ